MRCRAPLAAPHVLLHRKRVRRIKLAIGQAVQQQLALRARQGRPAHRFISFGPIIPWLFQAAANILRARARRDMTVPAGTPTMSAISR